jgi:hypothetical protein
MSGTALALCERSPCLETRVPGVSSGLDAARSFRAGEDDGVTTADVDAWMDQTTNPKRDVIAAVRAVAMSDNRIEEAVKYRAPAFLHGGIMAYFHWNAQEFASLVFPHGSKIPGEFERLDGDGLQRMMRFSTSTRSKWPGTICSTSSICGAPPADR